MSSVSVIIPCYKYGHFLEACVASVLSDQDGVDVRVLIIDDASPDGSAEVAREIAAREPRVEVAVHTTNRGNIGTFNEGLIEWADGDYCILLSADDRVTPGALRRAADFLDANPRAGFVYGRALWCVEGTPLPRPRTQVRGWSAWPGPWWIERRFRQAENPIISPEVVVRTSLQQRVGGYDAGLPKAADFEMFMRLAAHADVGFIRGVDQAFYRVHAQSMSKTVSPLADLRQRRSVFEAVLDRYNDVLPDTERLSGTVHGRLGREALWAAGREYAREPVAAGGRAGPNDAPPDVDELLAFAVDCSPEVRRLPLFRALQAREGVGALGTSHMYGEKARWWLRRRSWKYRGV
jgi:glycosyltransferase involved in cell wall biosynthesis